MHFANYTQSHFVTTVLPAQEKQEANMSMASDKAETRSLRKRKHVDYRDLEDGFDEEDDCEMVPVKRRKTKPLPPSKVFPFLSLPPEIRNRIYALTVGRSRDEAWLVSKTRNYCRTVRVASSYEKRTCFEDGDHYYRRNRWWNRNNPNDGETDDDEDDDESASRAHHLLAVCRQIFEEAGPILYPKTFVLEDTTALHHFMSEIGPCKRTFVEKLVIRGYGHSKSHKAYNHPALSLLKDLPELKEFELDCSISWRWGDVNEQMNRTARQFFRDGFRWLRAVEGAVDKVKLGERALMKPEDEAHKGIFYKELHRLVNQC